MLCQLYQLCWQTELGEIRGRCTGHWRKTVLGTSRVTASHSRSLLRPLMVEAKQAATVTCDIPEHSFLRAGMGPSRQLHSLESSAGAWPRKHCTARPTRSCLSSTMMQPWVGSSPLPFLVSMEAWQGREAPRSQVRATFNPWFHHSQSCDSE